DLEQNTYYKLFANDYKLLRAFIWPDENAIFRYLKATATSVACDWLRDIRNTTTTEELTDWAVGSIEHCQSPDHKILLEQVDRYLRSLKSEDPERDRAVFWLFYRWGFTAKQISRFPSIQLGVRQVEGILQRLVRNLRERLNHDR